MNVMFVWCTKPHWDFEGFFLCCVYYQNNITVNSVSDTILKQVASFGEVGMK